MVNEKSSRRHFVKASSAIAASSMLSAPHLASAQNSSKTLKVGLVGIGGWSGAAAQAMGADDNVALTAIGDLFEDRIKLRSRILKLVGVTNIRLHPKLLSMDLMPTKKSLIQELMSSF